METHKKILLVDDDADDQLFFVDAINELNSKLECGIANNGVEALQYLQNTPLLPSLIFLDLNMPLMNGFECLNQLKQIDKLKEIPVIIFTTSNHAADIDLTLSMGAKMFLTKPSDFIVLKNKLNQILQTFILTL